MSTSGAANHDPAPDRPPRALLDAASRELAGVRAQLLRRAGIAHRGPVLELGSGGGPVTEELRRRSRGPVIALDRDPGALEDVAEPRIIADIEALPLDDRSIDLVFAQHVFLWAGSERALDEATRVLAPGGVLVALEPDFGGALEHPPEVAIADVWMAALRRAGADPFIGRTLPPRLAARGLRVETHLPARAGAPDPARFDRLAGLRLTCEEAIRLERARTVAAQLPAHAQFVHIPYVCVLATR
jgi:SAM-dependent methyltransferase